MIDISRAYKGDFVQAVQDRLEPAAPLHRPAAMVTGIDSLIYSADDVLHGGQTRPAFVARLNFDREAIASRLPFPIVLWTEPEGLRLLLREAPDLSQWISARFDFGEMPEYGAYLIRSLISPPELGRQALVTPDAASSEAVARELEKSADATGKLATAKRAILLLMQAARHLRSSERAEARGAIREAINLAHRWGEGRVEAAGRQSLAALYLGEGKFKLGIRQLRTALRLLQAANDQTSADAAALDLANAYVADRDYSAASILLRNLIGSPSARPETRLDALVAIASAHARSGDKQGALDAINTAIPLMKGQDPRENSRRLMSMAESARNGSPSLAVDLNEKCLAIARKAADRPMEAECLTRLGLIYAHMGEHRRALSYLQESLAIYKALGNADDQAGATGFIAYLLAALGEFDRASEFVRESLEVARRAGNPKNEGRSLLSLSMVAAMKGDTVSAIDYARAATQVLSQVRDPLKKFARGWLAKAESGKLPPIEPNAPASIPAAGR